MSSYNKQKKEGIKKKKPVVWRKEAVWGIEPEFNHDQNYKKKNWKAASLHQVKSIQEEQDSRE